MRRRLRPCGLGRGGVGDPLGGVGRTGGQQGQAAGHQQHPARQGASLMRRVRRNVLPAHLPPPDDCPAPVMRTYYQDCREMMPVARKFPAPPRESGATTDRDPDCPDSWPPQSRRPLPWFSAFRARGLRGSYFTDRGIYMTKFGSARAVLVGAAVVTLAGCGASAGSSGAAAGNTSSAATSSTTSPGATSSPSSNSNTLVTTGSVPFPIAVGNTWVY